MPNMFGGDQLSDDYGWESNKRSIPGPAPTPTCEHGKQDFANCPDCRRRDKSIRQSVRPLADSFWENRGSLDVEDLLIRAYRMGMRHDL